MYYIVQQTRLTHETLDQREARLKHASEPCATGDCVTHETPEETATRCEQDRESHRIRREQQSVGTKIVNFHSHLAALQVPPFVPLSQSHGVPSPSPACVEAFSLFHPPLIQRLAERRHIDLL